jgi:hypothetical protein
VFQEKLEHFHRAFGQRYGGQPWVRYVDIGAFGSYGEGQRSVTGQPAEPVAVIKQLIDIYVRQYPSTRLVLNAGYVTYQFLNSPTGAQQPYTLRSGIMLFGARDEAVGLADYATLRGMSWRDDAIGTAASVLLAQRTSSVVLPELFEAVWSDRPTVLELEHYGIMKEAGLWTVPDGGAGATMVVGAIELAHATYLGYHGWADEWFAENPQLTRTLANRLGYWYFPKSVSLPERVTPGGTARFEITWENHGVAPAYHRYDVRIEFASGAGGPSQSVQVPSSDNRRWKPGEATTETYDVHIPRNLAPGLYKIGVSLLDTGGPQPRPVEIGLQEALRSAGGFVRDEVAMARAGDGF